MFRTPCAPSSTTPDGCRDAALDRQIAFTDDTDSLTESRIGLIDEIVYRLYGLSEEEAAVGEGGMIFGFPLPSASAILRG